MHESNPCCDFDEWVSLARTDPAAFEERRSLLIEDFIQSSPDHMQRRLRGLQFKVDMERRRSRTPMAACIRISSMMWDSFVGKGGLRDALNEFSSQRVAHVVPKHSGIAHIIRFKKPDEY